MKKFNLTIKHDDELKDTAEVYVNVLVDGHGADFILDTGCSVTSLFYNDFSATYPALEQGEYSSAFGKSKSDKILVNTISLGDIKKNNCKISRTPKGGNAKNLLGMDFLGDHYFELFLSENQLVLSDNSSTYCRNDLILDSGKIPFIEVSFEGKIAKAVWDTGAGVTIVDQSFFEANKNLFKNAGSTSGTDSTGTTFATPIYSIEFMEIGGIKFPEHRVVPLNLGHLGPKTGRGMDFILGYSTLKLANWAMDFKNKKWQIMKTLF